MDQTQQNGKAISDSQAASNAARDKLMDELKSTIGEAEKWLQDHGANPEHIRTAALIAAPDPSQSRVFYPSYMLANVSWVFFPWSSNSPHYSDYANWKRSHAL